MGLCLVEKQNNNNPWCAIGMKTVQLIVACVVAMLIPINLFSVVYNYTGVHITNDSRYTDYKWEPRQYFSTMNEGYSWFKFDENGFNNAYKYKNNAPIDKRCIDILLMGSSHMEAVQINPRKNSGYLLNKLMVGSYTYNIGISGHDLYTCFKNLSVACKSFSPKKYVIIETSTVKLDSKSIKMVNTNCLPVIKSYDKGLIYIIQKSIPGIKLLYKKIVEWKDLEKQNSDQPKEIEIDNEYQQNLDIFMQNASKTVNGAGAQLVLVYHPLSKIDRAGNLLDTRPKGYLEAFHKTCKKNKIIFIDLTEAARIMYVREHRLTHGFINTAVGVGHLNEYGHMLFAREVSKKLCKRNKR